MRRLLCFFGFHQWTPIRYVWVRFHRNLLYKDKYAEEGELVASKIYCPICRSTQNIKVEL